MSESYEARVDAIKLEQGETVALDDVAEVVHSLMTTMEGDLSAAEVQLQQELQDILDFIQRTKQELAALGPDELSSKDIPAAADELDAVVLATEEATSVYLDAAEKLENMADALEGDTGDSLRDIATSIYEASNFQDITGQRIGKVVGTLRLIESRVERLGRVIAGAELPEDIRTDGDEEADLLNGPALPQAANSQDEIDALLASFD